MNYDEAVKVLATSSRSDWIIDDALGTFTYKNDLNLHIKRDDEDEGRAFSEPWANKHPDPHARSNYYDVRYGQSQLERKHLVVVDGGRAILPIPRSVTDLTVSKEDLNFAQIVDEPRAVDEYLSRSGIKVS